MTSQSAIVINPTVDNRLVHFLQILLEVNQKTNLTAIKDYNDAYIKHLQDSLAIYLWNDWKQVRSGIDLGTGGGLPGIPLALTYPDVEIKLMDSNNKKVTFLKEVKEELQINNVEVIQGRAEEYGQKSEWRERFDFVTSRAVSSISVLLELAIPFLKVGGYLIAYKGPNIDEELRNSKNAQTKLLVNDPTVISYILPCQAGERNLIIYKKLATTPKIYPRRPGMPEKRPL